MNLTNEQIGQRIKAVRSEKNLTQTQLAQLLGKSLRTVQSYESGESRILLDTVTTIAHALGVTPAYLLGVSEPQIKLNTLADVVTVLYELNKKQELHFDFDITHERCDDGNFTASLKFRATDPDATLNETLCFLLEQFSSERSWGEDYWHDPSRLTSFTNEKIAQYANTPLTDKPLYTADLSKYDMAELKNMTKEQLDSLK